MRLLLLACTLACRAPDAVGPYLESTLPIGTGHDFVGTVGAQAQYGATLIGVGVSHPESGVEAAVVRLGFLFPVR